MIDSFLIGLTYCAATWFLFFKFQSLIRRGSHEGWLKAKNKQTLIRNCNWVSTEKGSYVQGFKENLSKPGFHDISVALVNKQHKLARFWAAPIKSSNDAFVAGLSLYICTVQ